MSVAIVGMGRSMQTYVRLCAKLGDRRRLTDETWAINAVGGVLAHDLLFHMDDLKIQEDRAERLPDGTVAGMVGWLKTHPRFMTSRAYPDYPGAVEFPLEAVLNSTGAHYLNSTTAYALAYALHQGHRRIGLYGCDFSYPHLHKAESGRACVEFLVGIAAARGVEIMLPNDTTLLDASEPTRFYGYDTEHVEVLDDNGRVRIKRSPRAVIPTAEEIEARYNHEPKHEPDPDQRAGQ